MSTSEAGPYVFDHGAQYFTARTAAFQSFIQPLVDMRIVERWQARYVRFDGPRIVERKNWIEDEPRYVGVPGMNAVANYLAGGLDVQLETRISALHPGERWSLEDERGHTYSDFDWVISTLPSPQAIRLLPEIFSHRAILGQTQMQPCFSLMLGFYKSLSLGFEAAHVDHSDISWIAVNSHKPGRPKPFTMMVHAAARYTEAHADDDPETVMRHLMDETSHIVGHDVSKSDFSAVHRWQYANNVRRDVRPVLLDADHNLAACGDWCQGGRVEGAFMSAFRLASSMKAALS
jgi:predicted NAD/FAD-dependent oxidoreductase